mmetsp:Transcript_39911/g.77976  ORF Transcript_39911/g.77976 Transcript_39911/m.77976 type:complete len:304 (-) Transcript_39911:102-1013(-)
MIFGRLLSFIVLLIGSSHVAAWEIPFEAIKSISFSRAPSRLNAAKMLADGTNPEDVDPVPGLNWNSKAALTDVIIYGTPWSPPVSKLRHHLAFAGVEYRCVKRSSRTQPEGGYQKIPSIEAGGRVVNDSYIIVKNLLPALYGNSCEQSLVMEWEKKISYGLQLAMEVEAMEDPESLFSLMKMTTNRALALLSLVFRRFFPLGAPGRKLPTMIRSRRAAKDDKYGPLKTMPEYLEEFKERIASDSSFFDGAEGVTAVDISMYATIQPWYTLPHVRKGVDDAKLSSWWSRMESAMPENLSEDEFV